MLKAPMIESAADTAELFRLLAAFSPNELDHAADYFNTAGLTAEFVTGLAARAQDPAEAEAFRRFLDRIEGGAS